MNNKELAEIKGGAITATMLNAVARCIDSLYSLGRSLGTGIRMIFSKKTCK